MFARIVGLIYFDSERYNRVERVNRSVQYLKIQYVRVRNLAVISERDSLIAFRIHSLKTEASDCYIYYSTESLTFCRLLLILLHK